MSRIIKKVKSLFESSYDDLLCPNCNQPFPRWRTSYMEKCRQCGTCVEINVAEPTFTARSLLVFLPVFASVLGNPLVATDKTDRFLAAMIIYGMTSGILYFVLRFGFKVDLRRHYRETAKVIPQSQYDEQHIPPKKLAIIVVSAAAIILAVFFLMNLGLKYSPLGNLP